MNTAITAEKASEIIEAVIAKGDIAQLSPQERAKYYVARLRKHRAEPDDAAVRIPHAQRQADPVRAQGLPPISFARSMACRSPT